MLTFVKWESHMILVEGMREMFNNKNGGPGELTGTPMISPVAKLFL